MKRRSLLKLREKSKRRDEETEVPRILVKTEVLHCESLFSGDDNMHMDNQQMTSHQMHTQSSLHEARSITTLLESIQTLRNILKDYIERECRGGVTKDYDDLEEPAKEVFPKLLQLLRFYEGDLLKMMSQYQKDSAFKYKRKATLSGKELDYETFLRHIMETETKRISVIAQAGSGKTVMLKRLARDLAKHNDNLLIFSMNFRDFTDSKEITPCDFLINGRLPDSDAKHSYEWILENQDKVMLVLDGLDQATWDIDEKAKLVGDYNTGTVSEIVSSIFRRKLFPDSKVVYSSREHAVAALEGQLRPEMVFAMTGLSPDDSEWLFKSFVGENNEILWEKLRTQYHSLIPLLSIPAFLIYTAIVYIMKPENPPRYMTEVLKCLLEIFTRSGHIMEKDIPRVLAGLKKMSFVGMKDGKVLFYIENVRNAGLDPKQICDWIITIPGLNKCNQFLLEGQYVLMFSHQTIQKFLAAQCIIEMDFKSFEEVVMEYLKNYEWSVVTRFVSGLLFNNEIGVDLNADDVEMKRNMLQSMLAEEYRINHSGSLELLAAISESNHSVFIRDLVHDIHLRNTVLGDSGAYVVASVMRHLVHLNELELRSCHLTSENLQILRDNIECSCLKISKLDMSSNRDIEDEGYATLGKIVKMCAVDELWLQECNLNDGILKNLLSETDGAKISKLDISSNGDMEDNGYATLGKIVKMCAVDELSLQQCALSEGKLKNLLSEMDGAKISKLDISNNMLEDAAYAMLGMITKMCAVDELCLVRCNLSEGKLQHFLSESIGTKIFSLDVSINHLDEDSTAILGDIVTHFSVDKLVMRSCGLNDASLKALLSRACGAKLSKLDVSYNSISHSAAKWIEDSITVEFLVLNVEDKINHPLWKTTDQGISPKMERTDRGESSHSGRSDIYGAIASSDTSGISLQGHAAMSNLVDADSEDNDVEMASTQDVGLEQEIDASHTTSGTVKPFKTAHFNPFKAVSSWWSKKYLCHYLLFCPLTSTLCGLACIDDENVKSSCISSLTEKGFQLATPLPDQVVLSHGEQAHYNYSCIEPAESQLEPDIEVLTMKGIANFQLNSFVLLPPPAEHTDMVRIKFDLTTPNGVNTSVLALNWRTSEVEGRKGIALPKPVNIEVEKSTRAFYESHKNSVDVYPIDPSRTKGKVLIINNSFKGQRGEERFGSRNDVYTLWQLWNNLGFDVQTNENLSADQMQQVCREFAKNAQNVNIITVIIMSHGGVENGEDFITGEDGNRVSANDIVSDFTSENCPHLDGIPKLFIFQVCRGRHLDAILEDTRETQPVAHRHFERADMLIVFPCQSGHVSYKNPYGSVFVNAVVETFMHHAQNISFLELMARVNNMIMQDKDQVPTIQCINFLRKNLFLFPGWP